MCLLEVTLARVLNTSKPRPLTHWNWSCILQGLSGIEFWAAGHRHWDTDMSWLLLMPQQSVEAPHSRSIINVFQALCTYSDLTFPHPLSNRHHQVVHEAICCHHSPSKHYNRSHNSLVPYPKKSQETDLFSLPLFSLPVFLTRVTSTPPYIAVSYFCCIFDKHFLAAHVHPSFSNRFLTFHSLPASRNLSPLLFAVFTHFLKVLSELHNKSKSTKYFPPCKMRFAWVIVSLLSYLMPRWTPGSFGFCTSDIVSLYPLITIAASSAACPASKVLPQQPIIFCGLCIKVSTWIAQGNPLLSLVFPRQWTCHIIQGVPDLAFGWWMACRHSLSGMPRLQKFHQVQIKMTLTLSSFGGWLGLRISPDSTGEVVLSNLLLLG